MATKRILLKLSGESLSDGTSYVSESVVSRTVNEIKSVLSYGIQLAIVIGAGNIWRGAGKFVGRVVADEMGMLATIMNSMGLKDALSKVNVKSVVFSAISISGFVESFNVEKVVECLEDEKIVIFAGGTGHPFFTTDTTAALRAAEIKSDMLLKATQINGVYSADPKKNKNAVKFNSLSFKEAFDKRLKIMDAGAFALCMQADIPIIVFDFYKDGNLKKVISGQKIGTVIGG